MKRLIAMMAGAALLAGCQAQNKPQANANVPAVLDVSAPPPSYRAEAPVAAATPPYMLPSAAAPESAPLVRLETQTPAPIPASAIAPAARAGGSRYTVRKGDTLYRIAKARYGNGRQWQRIAAANPGVSANSLHIGQTLVMP